jgi:PKD repeat protein
MYKLEVLASVLVILFVSTCGCSFLSTTSKPAMKPGLSNENSPGEMPTLPDQYVASSAGTPGTGSLGIATPTLTMEVPLISAAQSSTINGTGLSGNATNSSTSNISASIPVARFTSNVRMGFAPLTVKFMDSSLNMPTAWIWNFGDGSSSTLQNPNHTYYSGGQYTVGFTAANAAGSSFLNSTNYISVYVPGFFVMPDHGFAPLTVTFIDTGSGYPQPTAWYWDFGDSQYSTIPNTTHQYLSPGSYDVKLKISGKAGTAWVNRSAVVTVT